MTIDSKTEAQKRTDRINAFRAELTTLQQEHVVTLDQNQQSAIQDYHQKLLAGLSDRFDV